MPDLFTPVASALAVSLVGVALVLGGPTPVRPVDKDAISQSVFQLAIESTAYVAERGSTEQPQPVSDNGSCSAWAVDATHLVTDRHCVDPDQAKANIAHDFYGEIADEMPESGPMSPQDRLVFTNDAPPDIELTKHGQVINDLEGVKVSVESYQPANGSDLAILKVDGLSKPLVPLVVAREAPATMSQVIAVGYPGDMGKSDSIFPLVFEPGSVAGTSVIPDGSSLSRTLNVTMVSAPTWQGMSGGPLIDQRGEVVGTNDAISGKNPVFAFATQQGELREFLGAEGIKMASPSLLQVATYRMLGWTLLAVAAAIVLAIPARKAAPALGRRFAGRAHA